MGATVRRPARSLRGRDRGPRWSGKGVMARRGAQPGLDGRASGATTPAPPCRPNPKGRGDSGCHPALPARCGGLPHASPAPCLAPRLALARAPISAAQAPSRLSSSHQPFPLLGPAAFVTPAFDCHRSAVHASGGPGHFRPGECNLREHYARIGFRAFDGEPFSPAATLVIDIAVVADAPVPAMLPRKAAEFAQAAVEGAEPKAMLR
jgi:hypothetical protein